MGLTPFPDTSYSTVSIQFGRWSWCQCSILPVTKLKFLLKLQLMSVVAGYFLQHTRVCGFPLGCNNRSLQCGRRRGSSTARSNSIGNHTWFCHTDATSTTILCSVLILCRHLPSRVKGGNAYPSSSFQLVWKVSVSMALGSGLQLMYLSSWLFSRVANRSVLHGPKYAQILWNDSTLSIHSAEVCTSLDSQSAVWLLRPGRCEPERVTPFWRHQLQAIFLKFVCQG